MASRSKRSDNLKITDRIMSLVQNLSDEKKNLLIELLIEWQQKENRKHSRISCNFPVDYSTKTRIYHDFIQDLSKGGLFIETREPLGLEETIALTFTLPKTGTHFKIAGKIVRIEKSGVAVDFDEDLSDYQEEAIRKTLDSKS